MMKIIKVIQTIIIILAILLVAYWMWMRTPDDKKTKLSKICGQMDLSQFTITVDTKSKSADNYKINFSIKNNLDYYYETYSDNTYANVFAETGYPNSAISKIYYKNNEIAFIEEGYEGDNDFDRYYITSLSNTVDESNFEIPLSSIVTP